MKFGYEVEGRLKGMFTLFMQADEAVRWSEDGLRHALRGTNLQGQTIDSLLKKTAHVYISDRDNVLEPDSPAFRTWAQDRLVTLDVASIHGRNLYPDNVTVMLTVTDSDAQMGKDAYRQSESFWGLYATDQVKFTSGKNGGNHKVYVVTKENMTYTAPEDFESDIIVELPA